MNRVSKTHRRVVSLPARFFGGYFHDAVGGVLALPRCVEASTLSPSDGVAYAREWWRSLSWCTSFERRRIAASLALHRKLSLTQITTTTQLAHEDMPSRAYVDGTANRRTGAGQTQPNAT